MQEPVIILDSSDDENDGQSKVKKSGKKDRSKKLITTCNTTFSPNKQIPITDLTKIPKLPPLTSISQTSSSIDTKSVFISSPLKRSHIDNTNTNSSATTTNRLLLSPPPLTSLQGLPVTLNLDESLSESNTSRKLTSKNTGDHQNHHHHQQQQSSFIEINSQDDDDDIKIINNPSNINISNNSINSNNSSTIEQPPKKIRRIQPTKISNEITNKTSFGIDLEEIEDVDGDNPEDEEIDKDLVHKVDNDDYFDSDSNGEENQNNSGSSAVHNDINNVDDQDVVAIKTESKTDQIDTKLKKESKSKNKIKNKIKDKNKITNSIIIDDDNDQEHSSKEQQNHQQKQKHKELKTPISETFKLLLEACRTADPTADMEKLINRKLIRYYQRVHPDFVNSRSFNKNVISVTEDIKKHPKFVYLKISGILEELDIRRKSGNTVIADTIESINIEDDDDDDVIVQPIMSTESNGGGGGGDGGGGSILSISSGGSTSTSTTVSSTLSRTELLKNKLKDLQIKRLNLALYKINKMIAKLDEHEVDLDDDYNSSFLLVERYKKRACEIYEKICDITGESKHAHRLVKRPIKFNGTRYPEFNKSIQQFVNRAKIFPDMFDVLRCLEICNAEHGYDLTKDEIKSVAQDAFIKIGRALQKRRKTDLYQTVDYFNGSNTDDPAYEDPELQEKLKENQKYHSNVNDLINSYAIAQGKPLEDDDEDDVNNAVDENDQLNNENDDKENQSINYNTKENNNVVDADDGGGGSNEDEDTETPSNTSTPLPQINDEEIVISDDEELKLD